MTKKITVSAVLTAVALIIFVLEALIPPISSAVPGIKLGLANIVTLFTLYALGPWYALAALLGRIILGGIFTGQMMTILYSLGGGLLSYAVCALVYRFFPEKQMWALSIISAVLHNAGQILVAMLITSTAQIYMYFPVLAISGIITGTFTGLSSQFLYLRLKKTDVLKF